METSLAKLERVVPVAISATGEGVADAARDAWQHLGRTSLEFGVSAGVGAVLSCVQAEAGLPKIALELGFLGLTASSVKSLVEQGTKGFHALQDAWHSPANLIQDRQDIAASFGPLAFDTVLTTTGAIAGARLSRTVPVALKERSILNEMRSYHAESAEHSVRVGQYAQLSAKELGLPWGEQSEATHTGLMHDAGKLDMPMSALDQNQTGILSEEEWQIMHQHPLRSFERLQQVPYKGVLRNVPTNAMQHHEWINGAGYPHNLTGEQMRMAAKVVPPVDVFDAVTSGRAYMHGQRVPLGKVKQVIDAGRGTHFEPAAVDSLWSIPADKAIAVLESAPHRMPPQYSVLKEFDGVKLGRLLDVMNGAKATDREVKLAELLDRIYHSPGPEGATNLRPAA